MEEKIDLRTLKTKGNIKNAFILLALKKGVQDVTVKEICDHAQCSRSTFYQYYPYKEALYHEITESIVVEIVASFSTTMDNYVSGTWYNISETYLRRCLLAITKLKDLFPLMPPKSEMFNSFIINLVDKVAVFMSKSAVEHFNIRDISRQKFNQSGMYFLAGGIISFGVYWLTETDFSLDEAIDIIRPLFKTVALTVESESLGKE